MLLILIFFSIMLLLPFLVTLVITVIAFVIDVVIVKSGPRAAQRKPTILPLPSPNFCLSQSFQIITEYYA